MSSAPGRSRDSTTMADGGFDLTEEEKEKLLTCEICQEEFQSPKRLPRILPCFHCLCDACLQKLIEADAVKCPMCRRSHPADGMFQVDSTRMTLLDMRRTAEREEELACEGCSEDSKAQARCLDCVQFLCQECLNAHCKMKVFKDHSVVSLSEAAQAPSKLVQLVEKCPKHGDEKLRFVCTECQSAVCSSCAILFHTGHKMVELAPVLKQKRLEVLSLCEQMEKALPEFRQMVDLSSKNLKAMDAGLEGTASGIQAAFSSIISQVLARQDEILADLKVKVKEERLAMEEQVASNQARLTSPETSVHFGRRLASLGLPSQLLTQPAKMKASFEDLKKQGSSVRSASSYWFDMNQMPDLTTAMGKVGTLTQLPFPSWAFKLDADRCGPKSWVGADGKSLSNQPSTDLDTQRQAPCVYRFHGTSGTLTVSDQTWFWQVRCSVLPRGKTRQFVYLCEMGVASRQALLARGKGWSLPRTDHCSLTAMLCTGEKEIHADVYFRGREVVTDKKLVPYTPEEPVTLTFGFLMDHSRHALHVIHVADQEVVYTATLAEGEVLWPVVSVVPFKDAKAVVKLDLLTGQDLEMSNGLLSLLQTVLKED